MEPTCDVGFFFLPPLLFTKIVKNILFRNSYFSNSKKTKDKNILKCSGNLFFSLKLKNRRNNNKKSS